MSVPLRSCTLAAALWVSIAGAPGQELAISRVLVDAPLALSTTAAGATVYSDRLPPGTDVTAGLTLASGSSGAGACANSIVARSDQSLVASIQAACIANGLVGPGVGASAGRPTVIVHVLVPRPMFVRLRAGVAVSVSPVAPPCRGVVDVGADGTPELDFTSRPGECGSGQAEVVLALPAGDVPIRLQIDVELPVGSVGGTCVIASATASVTVESANVAIADAGPMCSSLLQATPMLDGTRVRFYVGQPSYGAGWLVLGAQPAAAVLPFVPGCSLLVQPDVVMPAPYGDYVTLPLGLLAPVKLFAQGVVFEPPMPWSPAARFLTSQPLRLDVR